MMPTTESEVRKIGSECRTSVEGSPSRYAARKIPAKTVPAPSDAYTNFVICLLFSLI